MSAACSEACGFCGGCTAAWEREDEDENDPAVCVYCNSPIDEDAYAPFCGPICAIDAANEGDGR